ncbi:10747_t:CDS:2, partial [Racocetra persica]
EKLESDINENIEEKLIYPGKTAEYLHAIADYSKKDYKTLQTIMLSDKEWSAIQNLILVLQPFAEATNLLGSSTYYTYSMMNPILISIKQQFMLLALCSNFIMMVLDFSNNKTVFDDNNTNEEAKNLNTPLNSSQSLLPSILDPRIKNLAIVSEANRYATEKLLKEKFVEMKTELSLNDASSFLLNSNFQQKTVIQKIKQLKILANLKKLQIAVFNEVSEYLKLEEIDFESDAFNWWYERHEKFPILNRLAKKYLAVYACSTASERLFSNAGNLLTIKRT